MAGNYSIVDLVPQEFPVFETCGEMCNETIAFNETMENGTDDYMNSTTVGHRPSGFSLHTMLSVSYSLVYILGTVGNGLVIFVILRFTKMKTVTNTYILNLAIADFIFLAGLPFLLITLSLRRWVFGLAMCKIFYCSFGINIFTGVFFICVMSVDRYLAVCYPMKMKFRSPFVSYITVGCVWAVSFIVMIPIFMYSTLKEFGPVAYCHIEWPENTGPIPGHKAFIWYSFLLAFVIPLALSSVLYVMVVIRLQNVGPANRSKEKKRRTRKITIMVLSVIAVYFCCWLPYWVFQAWLVLPAEGIPQSQPLHLIIIFNVLVLLSYANSMLNPILYAFMSENFRRSFLKAFRCACGPEFDHRSERSTSHAENGNRRLMNPCSLDACVSFSNCRRHMRQRDEDDTADQTIMTGVPSASEANGFKLVELHHQNGRNTEADEDDETYD